MKDAKGHGSNSRGAAMSRLAAAHKNPNHPLGVLHRVVAEGVARSGAIAGQDAKAATELARDNPKAAAAPVHPGAAGPGYWPDRSDAVKQREFRANSSEARARIYGRRLRRKP